MVMGRQRTRSMTQGICDRESERRHSRDRRNPFLQYINVIQLCFEQFSKLLAVGSSWLCVLAWHSIHYTQHQAYTLHITHLKDLLRQDTFPRCLEQIEPQFHLLTSNTSVISMKQKQKNCPCFSSTSSGVYN